MGRSNRANPNPQPSTSNAVAGQGTPGLVQPYQQKMYGDDGGDAGDTNDVYGMKHSGFRAHFGHITGKQGLTPTNPNHAGSNATQSLTPAGQWEDAPMGMGAYQPRTDLVPRTAQPQAGLTGRAAKQGGFFGMNDDSAGPMRAGGKQL